MTRARTETGASEHVAVLDGVRGLAVVLVLCVHFVGDATPATAVERAVVKLANYGVWGVDLFFVLSGFLITRILLRSRGEPAYFRNFYLRRTLRIFPLYYGVLAVLFGALRLYPAAYPHGLAVSAAHQGWLWSYGTNVYLAIENGWSSLPYVAHFWSLAVEEHFYLLWPAVVLLVPVETLSAVCIGLSLAALALRVILSARGAGEIPVLVLTPCRLDALCIGGLMATLELKLGRAALVARARRAIAPLALVALALSIWHLAQTSSDPMVLPLRGTVVALFFGALVLTSMGAAPSSPLRGLFGSPAMRLLGKYSYGLYVYHGVIAYAMLECGAERVLAEMLRSHARGMVAFALLGAGASVATAALSYEAFEKHFLRLKDRLAPRLHDVGGAARPSAALASTDLQTLTTHNPPSARESLEVTSP